MGRRSLLGIGMAGAISGLAGCGTIRTGIDDTLPAGPDLLIGACLELTGANAIVGTSAKRGLQVALDQINADGLRINGKRCKIRLDIQDNKSSPDTAAAVISEFITGSRVTAVIGGAIAATSTAMSPIAEKHQVPMLSLAAADSIVKPVTQHRFVFKLGPNATDIADLMGQDLSASKITSIGIMAESSAHGDAGVAALLDATKQYGISVPKAAVRLPLNATSYRAQAEQLAASHPEAIVVWSQAPTALAAATALQHAGYLGQLYFDTGAVADDAIDLSKNAALRGAKFVAPLMMSAGGDLPNSAPGYARRVFFNNFNRQFGPISTYAVFAADALSMVGTAAERAVDLTRLRVRNGLERAPFYLLGGAYTFSTINHGGVGPDQLTMLRLTSGGWTRV
jgi:branched-chain amino acid transport system substrate-binding protein